MKHPSVFPFFGRPRGCAHCGATAEVESVAIRLDGHEVERWLLCPAARTRLLAAARTVAGGL